MTVPQLCQPFAYLILFCLSNIVLLIEVPSYKLLIILWKTWPHPQQLTNHTVHACLHASAGTVMHFICSLTRGSTHRSTVVQFHHFNHSSYGLVLFSDPKVWYTLSAFWGAQVQHIMWLAWQCINCSYTCSIWCHMIITCKLHSMNLIGATEFQTETSSSARRKHPVYTRPFSSLRVGSGNETT